MSREERKLAFTTVKIDFDKSRIFVTKIMQTRAPSGLSLLPRGYRIALRSTSPNRILQGRNSNGDKIGESYGSEGQLHLNACITQIYGHANRSASVTLHSQEDLGAAKPMEVSGIPERVFAKFYQAGNPKQLRGLQNELCVYYTDVRLARYQIKTPFNLERRQESEESRISGDRSALLHIPSFLGIFEVVDTTAHDATNGRNNTEWSHALLFSDISQGYCSIDRWMPEERNVQRLVDLFRRSCSSLREFHEHGYLHGDISRGNLLLGLGEIDSVVLLDFERSR